MIFVSIKLDYVILIIYKLFRVVNVKVHEKFVHEKLCRVIIEKSA